MFKRNSIVILCVGLICMNLITVALVIKSNKINEASVQEGQMLEDKDIKEISESIGEEVRITADTDGGYITNAPIAAQVGHKVYFSASPLIEGDTLEVVGNNGYAQYPELTDEGFEWIPDRTGIFQVVIVNQEGNTVVSRNINVSDVEGGKGYQLNNLEVEEDKKHQVSFSTSIFSTPTNRKGNEAKPVTAFTIGEAGIWNKVIKGYDNSQTKIVEGKDFKLDRGSYSVRAALRDKYSVEDEDYKNITFIKEALDGHEVIIDSIDHTVVENENNGKSDKFIVNAHCSEGCDLVYAFFVQDSLGEKRLTEGENGYVETNVFTCPTTSWQYTFTVRVKHKKNSSIESLNDEGALLLPNAYEATESMVIGNHTEASDNINIKSIEIEPFVLKNYYNNISNIKQVIVNEGQEATVYAHCNNYITINLDEEGSFEYSATVTDDGEVIELESVEEVGNSNSNSHTFVYYPKSGGSTGIAANANEVHTFNVIISELDNLGYINKKVSKTLTLQIK